MGFNSTPNHLCLLLPSAASSSSSPCLLATSLAPGPHPRPRTWSLLAWANCIVHISPEQNRGPLGGPNLES